MPQFNVRVGEFTLGTQPSLCLPSFRTPLYIETKDDGRSRRCCSSPYRCTGLTKFLRLTCPPTDYPQEPGRDQGGGRRREEEGRSQGRQGRRHFHADQGLHVRLCKLEHAHVSIVAVWDHELDADLKCAHSVEIPHDVVSTLQSDDKLDVEANGEVKTQ